MRNKFDSVPLDDREEILKLKTWLSSLKMGLPRGDDRTRYLFEIYNEYFGGNVLMEESCSACLGKVLKKTNEFIQSYEH
jgi:hypothetical protein